ncbi:hypothetical protein MYU51_003677 [Penicillium brevicompactum]|uniref:uncharacterized protein n=1 Tax=Penicillium brevicompactum TaxID=5074 RepID=UPI0025424C0C|nr:uncharacterized protein N7506_000861 [Penicillium brevicompactum]KAJ5347608.1 hypothetical protein N7506_000861 [Penicillium brevicompactum]
MGVPAPSKLQLALALTLVKHKPPERDLKDYILEVRHFIKYSKDQGHGGSMDKFFDSVSFWQQAYEQSEAKQSKLQDQVHELQQKIDDLVWKLRVQDTGGLETTQANKRKAPFAGTNAGSPDEINKRVRLPGAPKQAYSLMDSNGPGDENTLCINRQIYTLQKALQKRPTPSSLGSLATAAVILCKSAEQKLILMAQNTSSAQHTQREIAESTTPETEAIFNGVTLAFHLVHKSLKKLAANENGKQHQAQVTYYLVGLFESIMTALTLRCTWLSNQSNKDQDTVDMEALASHLGDLLCTMALSLDLARLADQEVMEGFLFLLLRRIGNMLALHVFHDIRLPMGVCPGMSFPEGLEKMTDEGLTPSQAQIETRYLVRLLGRIFDVEPHPSTKALAFSQFVTNAKDRLQKTLLRAVFGSDEHMFQEVLRRPKTPPPLDGLPTEQEKFTDWLTQELWRLVGWDMLKTVFVSK